MRTRNAQPAPSAIDVANYLIKRATKEQKWLTPMQLQKLLYYAQCWHLAEYHTEMFPEPVEAWRMGPVVRSVWKSRSGTSKIIPDSKVFHDKIDDDAIEILESIWCAYGHIDGKKLSRMTHRDNGAWKATRRGLPDSADSDRVISKDRMRREATGMLAKNNEKLKAQWDDLLRHAKAS